MVAAGSSACLQSGERGRHLMTHPACRRPAHPGRLGGAPAYSGKSQASLPPDRRCVLLGIHFCPGPVVTVHDYRPFTESARLVLVIAVAMII